MRVWRASVADVLYIQQTRVCAAERVLSAQGLGLAGYRLEAGMTGSYEAAANGDHRDPSPLLLAKHLPPRRAKAQFGTNSHGSVQWHLDFEVIGVRQTRPLVRFRENFLPSCRA